MERRTEVSRRTYATFIDLGKAYNKVDWKLLFQATKRIGYDLKDNRLPKYLQVTKHRNRYTWLQKRSKNKERVKIRLFSIILLVRFVHI